jgi:hypothetical protein
MTVAQLRAEMSNREFAEWGAFFAFEADEAERNRRA